MDQTARARDLIIMVMATAHAYKYDLGAMALDPGSVRAGDALRVLDQLPNDVRADLFEATHEFRNPQCEGHVNDDATLTSGVGIGEATYCDGSCVDRRPARFEMMVAQAAAEQSLLNAWAHR